MRLPHETAPAYVVVGHIARDLVPGASPHTYTPGGTALYSTLTARRLGVETGVLTCLTPDVDPGLEGAEAVFVPSDDATVFENRYGPTGRVQYLHSTAAYLSASAIPDTWRAAPILHLGPIADEVDPSIAKLFPHALRAATPQGWLRRVDGDNRVYHLPHRAILDKIAGLDAIVVSEEDMAGDDGAVDEDALSAYRERVRIVILTRGVRGATIYAGQGAMHIPAIPAQEVDPTGAGDVFTTAFLIRYARDKDLLAAARFAAATASLVVEDIGPRAIPTQEQVETRLADGAADAVCS